MPQQVLGLDIGSSHLKAVAVDKSLTPNKLLRYAMVPAANLADKLMAGSDDDAHDASEFIKGFLREADFNSSQVVAVMPETKVFSKVISMPMLNGKEFDEAIKWEAEQHVPNPLSEVYLKYTILKEDQSKKSKAQDILEVIRGKATGTESTEEFGTMDVLLVAVPKTIVDRYMRIFSKAGLQTLGLEPISISIIRSTLSPDSPVPTIVVNLGQTNVDFYFALENHLRFVHTTSFGVSSIIKTISKELDVSPIQASEYLYTYGFKENVLGGRIKQIILPVFSLIIDELKKTQRYVESRSQYFSGDSYGGIKRVVLTGGGALIPDLMLYLVGEIKPEVQLGNPWKSLDMSGISQQAQIQLQELGPLFSAAVGAAVK